MPFNLINFVAAQAILRNRADVGSDQLTRLSVAAALVPGPFGIALPLIAARRAPGSPVVPTDPRRDDDKTDLAHRVDALKSEQDSLAARMDGLDARSEENMGALRRVEKKIDDLQKAVGEFLSRPEMAESGE